MVPLVLRFKLLLQSRSSGQILAELIQAGGETLLSAIHELINSIWNKEELPNQWKESIIVAVDKSGNQTNCTNYREISLLPTSNKTLSNIVLSWLSPYVDEIIGDHQCGFRHNISTPDQIFCICQILEKNWSTMRVHKLFIDFKKVYESVRREEL
jgi:hypothetical protein